MAKCGFIHGDFKVGLSESTIYTLRSKNLNFLSLDETTEHQPAPLTDDEHDTG